MAKAVTRSTSSRPKTRPALSPEARENQMIGYAIDLAEQQLLDGTASSQVITHFLKLGMSKAELEKEKLRAEIEEKRAKVKMIENAEETKTLYENAIKAMRGYAGLDEEVYDDEWDD